MCRHKNEQKMTDKKVLTFSTTQTRKIEQNRFVVPQMEYMKFTVLSLVVDSSGLSRLESTSVFF